MTSELIRFIVIVVHTRDVISYSSCGFRCTSSTSEPPSAVLLREWLRSSEAAAPAEVDALAEGEAADEGPESFPKCPKSVPSCPKFKRTCPGANEQLPERGADVLLEQHGSDV